MVLEQELFRQIALQKEELFRLVISNEQYKNCNNTMARQANRCEEIFLHNGLLAVQQYSTIWVRVLYCSCRLRCEKYYRLNSYNTRISPRPNVCVTAQNYCLTTLLQPLLCYLAYKEMYF